VPLESVGVGVVAESWLQNLHQSPTKIVANCVHCSVRHSFHISVTVSSNYFPCFIFSYIL